MRSRVERSNKFLFFLHFGFTFTVGYFTSRVLYDEKMRYAWYTMLPDNMRTLDELCERAMMALAFYDQKYDIPHELTFPALRKFYMSVKRERLTESKKAKKLETEKLIEDARLLDKKLLELEQQFEST